MLPRPSLTVLLPGALPLLAAWLMLSSKAWSGVPVAPVVTFPQSGEPIPFVDLTIFWDPPASGPAPVSYNVYLAPQGVDLADTSPIGTVPASLTEFTVPFALENDSQVAIDVQSLAEGGAVSPLIPVFYSTRPTLDPVRWHTFVLEETQDGPTRRLRYAVRLASNPDEAGFGVITLAFSWDPARLTNVVPLNAPAGFEPDVGYSFNFSSLDANTQRAQVLTFRPPSNPEGYLFLVDAEVVGDADVYTPPALTLEADFDNFAEPVLSLNQGARVESVGVDGPPPPVPVFPADGASGVATSPTLRWTPILEQQAGFELYLWPAGTPRPASPMASGAFTDFLPADGDLQYEIVPGTLEHDTAYSWQVVGTSSRYDPQPSAVFGFSTGEAPPPTPTPSPTSTPTPTPSPTPTASPSPTPSPTPTVTPTPSPSPTPAPHDVVRWLLRLDTAPPSPDPNGDSITDAADLPNISENSPFPFSLL